MSHIFSENEMVCWTYLTAVHCQQSLCHQHTKWSDICSFYLHWCYLDQKLFVTPLIAAEYCWETTISPTLWQTETEEIWQTVSLIPPASVLTTQASWPTILSDSNFTWLSWLDSMQPSSEDEIAIFFAVTSNSYWTARFITAATSLEQGWIWEMKTGLFLNSMASVGTHSLLWVLFQLKDSVACKHLCQLTLELCTVQANTASTFPSITLRIPKQHHGPNIKSLLIQKSHSFLFIH